MYPPSEFGLRLRGSLPRSDWSGLGFLVLHLGRNQLIFHSDELKGLTAKPLIINGEGRTPLV